MKIEADRALTTPIYYCNARPHLGHTYTTILADFIVRLEKLRGKRTWFITGTDEHGEKMAQTAAKSGKTPQEHCDEYSKYFRDAWDALRLSPDCFYRTSDPKHYELVQSALQRLYDKGEIYFAEYEGLYCLGCERYRKESELTPEGLCPDHLTRPEIRKEPNYFFKMSKYQERLVDHYKKNTDVIQPEHFRNEVLSMLTEPLEDLNISRSKERLTWGIELPFDKNFVTYVWFDALLSYLGGQGYTGTESIDEIPLWKETSHTLAKDILKTHAIYWPTMLWALDLPAPKKLIVHGYWLVKGHKMSKSLGNVVEPLNFAAQFGVEAMRYYLLSDMSFGVDASMTIESFVAKVNSDLANGLGNLTSRTLTLAHKNFEGKLPPRGKLEDVDQDLLKCFEGLTDRVYAEFDQYRLHIGIKLIMDAVRECDRYINLTAPWKLAKEGNLERLGTVLNVASEALYKLSILLDPILPESTQKLRTALGVTSITPVTLKDYDHKLTVGSPLGEVPRLFARLEVPKDLEEAAT
ncbi:MAG: methionine--tRNA ligase [Bdellovibrionota bacterium]